MRVKCLAQEHNTVSPARARTRTVRNEPKYEPKLVSRDLNQTQNSVERIQNHLTFSAILGGPKPSSQNLLNFVTSCIFSDHAHHNSMTKTNGHVARF